MLARVAQELLHSFPGIFPPNTPEDLAEHLFPEISNGPGDPKENICISVG
jgi:hypothetical protein